MLVVLVSECAALSEKIEHLNEKQEVLATLIEGKMSMQRVAPEKYQEKIFEELMELEERKTRYALELVQRKHKLVKWECERGSRSFCQSFGQFLLWFLLILPGT